MKKTILSLLICTLLITPIGVICTIAAPTTPAHQPPGPAYAPPLTYIDTSTPTPDHPTLPSSGVNPLIINVLQQVTPDYYLSYLQTLVNFGPRVTGTTACQNAAAWILQQFQDMGLDATYKHWTYSSYSSDNVEATINGTDTSSSDIYIICGHYDTVSAGPGADDDGSGTCAVIVAASLLKDYSFNFTLKFVCFSGEEEGLYGSRVYAQQAAAAGWHIIGVLNCDMVSYAITTTDGSNLIIYENTASHWLTQYTYNIAANYSAYVGLTLHNQPGSGNSDHYYFWQNGYNAIFFFEYTETPDHHQSGDIIAHCNMSYAAKNIKLFIATLAELAEISLKSDPPAVPDLTGPSWALINDSVTFSVNTTDPDGDNVYYYLDWGDGTNTGWVGPSPSGVQQNIAHAWHSLGIYNVTAKAKDYHGSSSTWTTPLTLTIVDNTPPNDPSIEGPTIIHPFIKHTYTINSTDPQNQDLRYDINWGDSTGASGYGPFASGQAVEITHTYKTKGNFTIRVRSVDTKGAPSNWTELKVHVPLAYQPHTLLEHLIHWLQGTRLGELLARLLHH